MKSSIRVYNEGKFIGYYVEGEGTSIKTSRFLTNASLYDSEDERLKVKYGLQKKLPVNMSVA